MSDESRPGTGRPDLGELRRLVARAFDKSKATGRTDWDTMTLAALKNRLLALTHRQFSEATYQASSMRELVALVPELLELDRSVRPPRVRLHTAATSPTPAPHHGCQIRPDLWNAVVDFSRGEPYVWTGTRAVPNSDHPGAAGRAVLPTLTREEELQWRAEFVSGLRGINDTDQRRIDRWLDRQMPTAVLPGGVGAQWRDHLKSRVLDRLQQWFHQHGIRQPADLQHPPAPWPEQPADSASPEDLRALLIRRIKNMTPEELNSLQLPAWMLLRQRT